MTSSKSNNGITEQQTADAVCQVDPQLAPSTAHGQSAESIVPWRVYMYGAGTIACYHAKAAETLKHVQIFAADPSPDARIQFTFMFPQATVYDDAESMLTSSAAQDHDIVVIAVPPWLHKSASLSAFRSKRHVLCEKPVARSEAELSEMLAASRVSGRQFLECSFRYLGNRALERARQLVKMGSIGTPYHARLVNRQPRARPGIEYQPQSRWFLEKEKAGGGTIFDFGVYDLAMFFDVLRPVAATIHRAWVATPQTAIDPSELPISVETHAGASMTLKLESGAVVAFDYERAGGFHGEKEVTLNVDGSAGGLTWQWIPTFDSDITEDGAEANFKLTHYVDVEGQVEAREELFPSIGWNDANLLPLLSFVDLIEGHPNVALSQARIAFNFGVAVAIYKSAFEGVAISLQLS